MNAFLELLLANAVAATVLGIGAALVCRFVRRPAVAHALWLLVLAKLVVPAPVRIPVEFAHSAEVVPITVAHFPEGPEPALPLALELAPISPVLSAGPAVENPAPWITAERVTWALLFLWIAGSAWCVMQLARSCFHFRRLMRSSRPASSALKNEVRAVARSLGLRRTPTTCLLSLRVPPMVGGLPGRTRLVLPQELLAAAGADGRRALLTHELAHLARRDHLVRWLEAFALILFWWLPTAWWARHELRRAEEECCDAWVLWTQPDGGRAYARALLTAVDFLAEDSHGTPATATALGDAHSLHRRLEMILTSRFPRKLGTISRGLVATLAVLLLPVLPTLAQDTGGGAGSTQSRSKAKPKKDPSAGAKSATTSKELIRSINGLRSKKVPAAGSTDAAQDDVLGVGTGAGGGGRAAGPAIGSGRSSPEGAGGASRAAGPAVGSGRSSPEGAGDGPRGAGFGGAGRGPARGVDDTGIGYPGGGGRSGGAGRGYPGGADGGPASGGGGGMGISATSTRDKAEPVQLIRLKYAFAAEIVVIVQQGVREQGQQGSVLVDARTNSLVLVGDGKFRKAARNMIKTLDQPVGDPTQERIAELEKHIAELTRQLKTMEAELNRLRSPKKKPGSGTAR